MHGGLVSIVLKIELEGRATEESAGNTVKIEDPARITELNRVEAVSRFQFMAFGNSPPGNRLSAMPVNYHPVYIFETITG